MIVSVHLADADPLQVPRVLLGTPDPATVPGLTYAASVLSLPLRDKPLPRPVLPRVGLIAAWEDDRGLDGFLAAHPLAARFAAGWHVRLQPLRLFGFWPGMPGLPSREQPVADDEPVAVLTLGRPRLRRIVPFLRAAAPAEHEATANPAVLASTALARPLRLVSTFSLWRSAAAMREYAHSEGGTHRAAVRADRATPFHHDSAFVRFRPYASRGSWGDGDPLAASAAAAA